MEQQTIHLLVTLNHHYCYPLAVMMTSFMAHHSSYDVELHILHRSLTPTDQQWLIATLPYEHLRFDFVVVNEETLQSAPTSKRYPHEIYYRLFAADYLPSSINRILYLDPDIIILNAIDDLYFDPFDNHMFKACTHVFSRGQRFNQLRLKTDPTIPYFNSGVMMMNLEKMRQVISKQLIYNYIEHNRMRLLLPDQDILTALFGKQIQLVDSLYYNLSEKYLNQYNIKVAKEKNQITIEWVKQHTKIIHYCGRNKPWNPNYRGSFGQFYHEYEALLKGE